MLRSETADIVEGVSQGVYSQSQHSQLGSQYNSQRTSSRCKICDNDTFYEDNYANFVCTICGTQMEDYIVESFEEDYEQLRASERRSLKRLSGIHAKVKNEKIKKEREIQSSTLDLLLALQFCLHLLTEEVQELSHVDGLVVEVRELWFDYLNAWKCSGHEITGYFSNLTEDDRRDENNYELDEDEGDSNGSSSDSYSENNEDES